MSSDQPAATIAPARLHPAWLLAAFVSGVRNSIFVFIGFGLSLRDQSGFLLLSAIVGLLLAILIYRMLEWSRISYEASNGAVTLKSGIFSRNEREVPVERIQAVNSVATPFNRLLGAIQLSIETAGAGDPLTIESLSSRQSDALRHWIEISRAGRAPMTATGKPAAALQETPTRLLRTLTPGEILITGLTSGRVGPALALIAAGFRLVTDAIPERYWTRLPIDPTDFSVGTVIVLLLISALVAWALSVISAVVTYWEFTLKRTADSLLITSGLLDRRQITIPLRRIQAISVVDGVLRQPFGYASVMIESASRFQGEQEESGSQTLIPLIRRDAIPALLAEAAPAFAVQLTTPLAPLPRRARRRYLTAAVRDGAIIVAIALAGFALIPVTPWWYGLGLIPVIPLLMVYAQSQYRSAGWAIDDQDRVIIRRRTVDRITTITPHRRVQLRSLSQSIFQRRATLATLTVKLAGASSRGTMTLIHLDAETARDVASRLGPSSSR